jgi:hypothetical protein
MAGSEVAGRPLLQTLDAASKACAELRQIIKPALGLLEARTDLEDILELQQALMRSTLLTDASTLDEDAPGWTALERKDIAVLNESLGACRDTATEFVQWLWLFAQRPAPTDEERDALAAKSNLEVVAQAQNTLAKVQQTTAVLHRQHGAALDHARGLSDVEERSANMGRGGAPSAGKGSSVGVAAAPASAQSAPGAEAQLEDWGHASALADADIGSWKARSAEYTELAAAAHEHLNQVEEAMRKAKEEEAEALTNSLAATGLSLMDMGKQRGAIDAIPVSPPALKRRPHRSRSLLACW